MAGSYEHLVGNDGSFDMSTIENLGDAHEALEECFALINELVDGDIAKLEIAEMRYRELGVRRSPYIMDYNQDQKYPNPDEGKHDKGWEG
ncbi:MAG: hypothetical protein JRI80_20080 [Deltaproteobacteria bacterium]|nr:hypothetical protein [Deltaproteobacteria bacterium]